MSKEGKDEIIIPTLYLPEKIKPLIAEIEALCKKIESINIFHPFGTYKVFKTLKAERNKLYRNYTEAIAFCYSKFDESVSAPGYAFDTSITLNFSKGFSAIFQLQSTWNELESLVDRKFAFSYAVIALYISFLSIIITVFLGVLSIK